MFECTVCKISKPPEAYRKCASASKGIDSQCRDCRRAFDRHKWETDPARRKLNRSAAKSRNRSAVELERRARYRREHRKQVNARQAVRLAVRDSVLVKPDRCQKCGNRGAVQAHHHKGYDLRLEVEWLCDYCHRIGPGGRVKWSSLSRHAMQLDRPETNAIE